MTESLNALPKRWKNAVAELMRQPLMRRLMQFGIWLTVPKQRVGVGIVVMDEAGRILLLRHVFHPFAPWGVPGGWLNRNEDPAAGALRELQEETGLPAELQSVIYIKHETAPAHLGIVFMAYATPQPLTLSGEILEARWFYLHELPEGMFEFVEEAIKTAVQIHYSQN